jgi:hypothetical protein
MKLCASASPAEDLFELARPSAKRIPHSLEMVEVPSGFEFLARPATVVIPKIVAKWLAPSPASTIDPFMIELCVKTRY